MSTSEPEKPDTKADTPVPDSEGNARDAGASPDTKADIRPGMTEQEIRDAGLAVDVPFETGPGRERLRYADLGADKKWEPPEGWDAQPHGHPGFTGDDSSTVATPGGQATPAEPQAEPPVPPDQSQQ